MEETATTNTHYNVYWNISETSQMKTLLRWVKDNGGVVIVPADGKPSLSIPALSDFGEQFLALLEGGKA